MAFVFLNIGSNLGNRRLHLSRAVRALGEAFGNFEASHAVESEPWGFDSTRSFLNMGVQVETDLQPEEILAVVKDVENSVSPSPHRDDNGNYIDREIDIDIMAIDMMTVDTPSLKVPHPHLPERRFFLEPFMEMAPGWRHPVSGLTPGEMLSRLEEMEGTGKRKGE